MKKTLLAIILIFAFSFSSFAQYGGGLFQRGAVSDEQYYGAGIYDYSYLDRNPYETPLPGLPGHGLDDNQAAPLGSGMLLLLGFGAAYALKKKSEE